MRLLQCISCFLYSARLATIGLLTIFKPVSSFAWHSENASYRGTSKLVRPRAQMDHALNAPTDSVARSAVHEQRVRREDLLTN
jgi:hypothetical protein